MRIINRHGISAFPLDRDQARLHQQVKPAIFILQLQRRIVFIPNRSGKFATISSSRGHGLSLFPIWPQNRIANLIPPMISCKPCKVSSDKLSSASDLVTSRTRAFPEKKILAPHWVARRGVPGGLALQQTHISNHRLHILFAQAREPGHSFFRNPIVNQIEKLLIRECLCIGPVDDVRRMLTAKPVEPMTSRAFPFENAFSPQVRFRASRSIVALQVLAKDIARRTKKNQHQSKLQNDSPGQVVFLGFRTSEGDGTQEVAMYSTP